MTDMESLGRPEFVGQSAKSTARQWRGIGIWEGILGALGVPYDLVPPAYYQADRVALYLGDCIEVMRALPEASVDAIVTDPPYGLEFMNAEWDAPWKSGDGFRRSRNPADVECDDPFGRASRTGPEYRAGEGFERWCEAWAREAYRVLKPGGHIAAFGGTRTHHRLVCGIEDAGFEIRDEGDWMYGSGFPKSLDVSKAIDRAAGAEREVIIGRAVYGDGHIQNSTESIGYGGSDPEADERIVTAPATAEAAQWKGWGTALKPAHEPICIARKPLSGTVAANVLAYGTGALNIDGCRIEGTTDNARQSKGGFIGYDNGGDRESLPYTGASGRWPANVMLDEEAAALLDATVGDAGGRTSGLPRHTGDFGSHGIYGAASGAETPGYADRGGPSRFFYTAKASRTEREAGLDALPARLRTDGRDPGGPGGDNPRLRVTERRNDHPTVKPVALMRWLVRLITPPGGVVLDPFLGSGSTGLAALDERMQFIGIDMDEHYVEVAQYRLEHRHILEERVREPAAELPQGRLF